MPVGVDRELDRGVAELVADVRERLPLGDEETRERVPEVVEAHALELGLLQDLGEHAVAEAGRCLSRRLGTFGAYAS